MTKGILLKSIIALSLLLTAANAQENVDAIEKARQAKEAADKAAAEAASATEAAIEAAAEKAAKEARVDAKRKKEEEEARKLAEAQAAEEAELDAAATAAANEAKRKMAAELGVDFTSESDTTASNDSLVVEDDSTLIADAEEVVAKEALGWNAGLAASVGLVKGKSFSGGLPMGATAVITTPYGFDLGPFKYTVSLGVGGYSASYENEDDGTTTDLNPMFFGLGGNLMIAEFVFAEGHLGMVGEGGGFRGFAGVSLEKIMKKALNLPVNLLIGSEAFYTTKISESGNASGWAALGVRLDYSF